ncbi:MAG: hypothetical protein KGS48_05750 [Bacteroidetes bacterium]|nr:hypothetical protein [Bacteroidota bacterium]
MEIKVSKAQISVWEWKDKAYEEIKHLPILEQMRIIQERTKQTIAQINVNKAKNKASLPNTR